MFDRHRLVARLILAAVLAGTGSLACAQSTPAEPPRKAKGDSLPDTVRRVERQTGGEVLRAEPMQRDGREVYRLKVLTADGRVRVLQDDPAKPRDQAGNGQDKEERSSDSDGDSQQ